MVIHKVTVLILSLFELTKGGSDESEEHDDGKSTDKYHCFKSNPERTFTYEEADDVTTLRKKYCSHPRKNFLDDVLQAERSPYHLVGVHILLSHGDTLSQHPVKKNDSPDPAISCNFPEISQWHDSRKVTSYSEIADDFREINPNKGHFKEFDIISRNINCSSDDLSPTSTVDSIVLGEDFASSYNSKLTVTSRRDIHKIRFVSNFAQPSYQTGLATLHGFLPEKVFLNVQPIKSDDRFCSLVKSKRFNCRCSNVEYQDERMRKSLLRGWHLFKDSFDTPTKLASNVGEITDGLSSKDLLHYIFHHVCNGRDLAADVLPKQNIEEFSERLIETSATNWRRLVHTPLVRSFSRLYVFPFLSHLSEQLLGLDNPKVETCLYSNTRFFMANFLISVGIVPDSSNYHPESLVIEVYRKESDRYIRVLYNHKDVTYMLPMCTASGGYCSVNAFVSYVLDTNSFLSAPSYSEAC